LKIGGWEVNKLEVIVGASLLLLILLGFLLTIGTIFGIPNKLSNALMAGGLIVGIPYFLCIVVGTLFLLPVFLFYILKTLYIIFTNPRPIKKTKWKE